MSDHRCHNLSVLEDGRPLTSGVMFSVAVVGNIVALVLLAVRQRTTSPSLYRVLATVLLMTDLLGNIAVSPVVLTAYAQRKTLMGMSAGGMLCSYFGFSMTFLSLSTLALLWLLAVERYVSIGHPYFYERHLSKRCVYIIIPVVYLSSGIFSLSGLGQYVQYCPGSWCFLEMSHAKGNYTVYIGFYASFILIITSSTVVCNICVIFHLVVMHRRHKKLRGRAFARSQYRRSLSMTEEVEHLLPLAIITVVFICCTFPIVLRVYINITGNSTEDHTSDLKALRLLSFHSIINPWVFIILRPAVLKIIWRKLSKQQCRVILGKTVSTNLKQTEEDLAVQDDSGHRSREVAQNKTSQVCNSSL